MVIEDLKESTGLDRQKRIGEMAGANYLTLITSVDTGEELSFYSANDDDLATLKSNFSDTTYWTIGETYTLSPEETNSINVVTHAE